MKIKTNKTLQIAAGITLLYASGCLTLKQQPTVKEPEIAQQQPNRYSEESIAIAEKKDTERRIPVAREAAEQIINDAKIEAENIKKNAGKEAEKIIDALTADMKRKKDDLMKDYIKQQKAEIAKKLQASKLKAKKESDKISNQLLKNAKKAAAEITLNAKKEADKIVALAKKYSADQKKAADDYKSSKIKQADKDLAKITSDLKKANKSAVQGAKPTLANTLLDTMLTAMKKDDYKTFSAKFTPALKKEFTEKVFKRVTAMNKKQLGDYDSREYLGVLNKGIIKTKDKKEALLNVYLWKARFSKAKKYDVVIRLIMGDLDGKPQVFGFFITNN